MELSRPHFRSRPALVSRLAATGLMLVLVAIAAVTVVTLIRSERAAQRIEREEALAIAYQQANIEFLKAQLTAVDLISSPSYMALELYRERMAAVIASLEEVARVGDEAEAARAEALIEHYVPLSEAFVDVAEASLAAGDDTAALLDRGPVSANPTSASTSSSCPTVSPSPTPRRSSPGPSTSRRSNRWPAPRTSRHSPRSRTTAAASARRRSSSAS